jgi:hypothetical protein
LLSVIRKSGRHGIQLYKNNTSNSGASHGRDENLPDAPLQAERQPSVVQRTMVCPEMPVGTGMARRRR